MRSPYIVSAFAVHEQSTRQRRRPAPSTDPTAPAGPSWLRRRGTAERSAR